VLPPYRERESKKKIPLLFDLPAFLTEYPILTKVTSEWTDVSPARAMDVYPCCVVLCCVLCCVCRCLEMGPSPFQGILSMSEGLKCLELAVNVTDRTA
jgi:hypothetical protein